MKGQIKVKEELIKSIHEKELQLTKLRKHIGKSEVCSDLYDKVLLEKAVLKQQLEELKKNSIFSRIKHFMPKRSEKLICDYFRG